jgi:hypothetical protein
LKIARALLGVLLAAALTVSCVEGKRPFTIVTVCLQNQHDVSEFLREMREEAERSGMTFTDGSARTARDMVALDARRTGEFVLNVGVEHPRGYGLMAGDLRSGYQVAVGFGDDFAGRHTAEAREWADAVVRRLEERWRVETVPNPAERGAFPMSDCPPT